MIAALSPTFTMLHTLTIPGVPCPVSGLAWHGSSSKQTTEMLATQTSDGTLRVWSVAKAPHAGRPKIIRVLASAEIGENGPNWFGWSKNGRLITFSLEYATDFYWKRHAQA